jgi:hypothetical protein
VSALLAAAAAAVACGLLLFAVGQPIFTDDLWWHLALGRAFAEHGPWLAEDPLLFAPVRAPSPASWLADVALARLAGSAGFHALRALHVAVVAGILALAWLLLRRAGASRSAASAGLVAFVALAAYRLVQLRPDLVTIGASLLVVYWLVADARPPSWPRIALASALSALWANAHAAFPLGLLVIGAALAGLVAASLVGAPEQRSRDRARIARLAVALACVALATLANPAGAGAHLAYLEAGADTPALELVLDEWVRVDLFAVPSPPRPPSLIAWALVWTLIAGVAWALYRAARPSRTSRGVDPALAGVGLLGLALAISAVRFLWLGIFPLLLVLSASRWRPRGDRLAAAAAVLVAACFFKLGDWPAITRGLPTTAAGYARPYPVGKYYAHAIWLLADSGVRGNLYNDYHLGGFAGYWLAPDVRSIVNGTLNVSPETLDALTAIAQRRGARDGERFTELLDRLGVDLFLGIRLPEAGVPGRTWASTTAHLEDTPGWIPIFRNLESALYLRVNERNSDNLDRIAAYYTGQGVPFDRERGFEIDAVIRDVPDWAVSHGVVPAGFVAAARSAVTSRGREEVPARDRVAALYAALGRYERAAALDRSLLAVSPEAVRVRRRVVWSSLRAGADAEAAAAAVQLAAQPEADGLSHRIALAAREVPGLDPEARRQRLAVLPVFTRYEVPWLIGGILQPAPRPPRP